VKKALVSLIIAAFAVFGATSRAQQQSPCEAAGIRDSAQVRDFLSRLQRAVAQDDRASVISMVVFPVGYGIPSGPSQLDATMFAERYDEIFDKKVKGILARQTIQELYCDASGLAVGHGEIWFGLVPGTGTLGLTQFDLSKYGRAGVESMSDTEIMDTSFLKFQRAVAQGDRLAVASMMKYPLRVETSTERIVIRASGELLEKYDFVFNPSLQRAVKVTKLSDLFATNTGIATKYGLVWFGPPPISEKWQPKVIAIANAGSAP
jgi:hypothetical protein